MKVPYRIHRIALQGDRSSQQDVVFTQADGSRGGVFAVLSDGAGGHAHGELASACVKMAFLDYVEKEGDPPKNGEEMWLKICFYRLNEAVLKETRGRGFATVVVAYIVKGTYWVIHAGDSRFYHLRKGKVLYRTHDDSLAQSLVDKGMLKEDAMGQHPAQSSLFKTLGMSEPVSPSVFEGQWEKDDVLFLCSDGVWTQFSPKVMGSLSWVDSDLGLVKFVLSAFAHARGKSDNLSALLVANN